MFDSNILLFSALLAALIAQILKVPISYWRYRVWDWTAVFQSGGMPSSHTALMAGLTAACLFEYGWNNPYFAISFVLTLIVMYDAAGVRRQAGHHAVILNKLTTTLQSLNRTMDSKPNVNTNPLKEVLGHNPIEVAGGILAGLITAIVLAK